jgi:hypothetical protein
MSVLSVLKDEHVLMLRFAGLLQWEEAEGLETWTKMHGELLALFCALERHEEFEDAVFAPPKGSSAPARFTEDLSAEHRRMMKLRDEVIEAVKNAGGLEPARARPLVDALAAHLRAQFKWEEEHLWPLYAATDPAGDRIHERNALSRLKELERSVLAAGVKLSDASGRGPDLRSAPPES